MSKAVPHRWQRLNVKLSRCSVCGITRSEQRVDDPGGGLVYKVQYFNGVTVFNTAPDCVKVDAQLEIKFNSAF